MTDVLTEDPVLDEDTVRTERRPLRLVLLGVIAAAALVVAGTVGWVVRGDGAAGAPSAASVDAGFAQDMSVHHTQAVTMANYERDHTTNPALHVLAYDIETEQQYQLGEMQGWLQLWHLPNANAHEMAWMGSDHMAMSSTQLMPGMATPAQLTRLQSTTGKSMDVLFLQLMIHHHQGGLTMAQYAAEHATNASVQRLAAQMVVAQGGEIIQMEQQLRQLGGVPLPPPAH